MGENTDYGGESFSIKKNHNCNISKMITISVLTK